MNNDSATFGNILMRERTKRELSLKELADFIGKDDNKKYLLSISYLNRLEKNEADNPSFKNICLLTKALYLDLYEVFKSFGYGELVSKDDRLNIDKIDDIIRTMDINAPLPKEYGYVPDWELLDFKEKEILISIIMDIFSVGGNKDNRDLKYIFDIVRNIYEYKSLRKEKTDNYVEKKRFENYNKENNLEYKSLEVIIPKQYGDYFAEFKLTDDYIDGLIGYASNDSYGIIDGKFKVEDRNRGLIFEINKYDNILEIISIEVLIP